MHAKMRRAWLRAAPDTSYRAAPHTSLVIKSRKTVHAKAVAILIKSRMTVHAKAVATRATSSSFSKCYDIK